MGDPVSRIQFLSTELYHLSASQISWVEAIVQQFLSPHRYIRSDSSDLINEDMLAGFGDALSIHHCLSNEPFTKDKFEYALVKVANLCGKDAQIAPKGNPGHDITIDHLSYSLKTQADRQIKPDEIHISKFMELGQGEWSDQPQQLQGLRQQFIQHLQAYERILSLRALSKPPNNWKYELVEIPKALLLEAVEGELHMMLASSQNPRPGYCMVRDSTGQKKFELYFDGGSERKLQVKHIQKKYCRIHALWEFPAINLYAQSHLSTTQATPGNLDIS